MPSLDAADAGRIPRAPGRPPRARWVFMVRAGRTRTVTVLDGRDRTKIVAWAKSRCKQNPRMQARYFHDPQGTRPYTPSRIPGGRSGGDGSQKQRVAHEPAARGPRVSRG